VRDANFLTGSDNLIAVDKLGNKILFLDPETLEVQLTLGGSATRVHELLIDADRTTAYVPIYGDGIHGNNPHPGHLIALIDLQARRHRGDFSTHPYLAPHGMRWGAEGRLYCVCEDSGVVLELDATSGTIGHVIEVGSNNAHRMEILPDGSKLYTENEEDAFCSVVDLQERKLITKIAAPGGTAGIGMSPDGRTIVLVDDSDPQILIVDTRRDEVRATVTLEGLTKPAQIARYSPDGAYLIVTSIEEPLGVLLSADFSSQKLLPLGDCTMNMAYKDDGRTVIIANQNTGTLSVCDLQDGAVLRTVQAGTGIETLSFF
jgi:DNA-binding beta-propeller fold protein YncE